MPYSKELWTEFYGRYMHDEILELANNFPDRKALTIPYTLLQDSWINLTNGYDAINYFINHPDIVIIDAKRALHSYIIGIEPPKDWDTAEVKIIGYPLTTIRDLRHNHIEKFVSVTGTIMRKTEVRFRIVTAAFECKRCGHITNLIQVDGRFAKPFECENDICGRKGPFKLVKDQCVWADTRKIRIQETFDQIINGEQSLSALDVVQVWDVECPPLGSIVTASGILRGIQVTKDGEETSDFYPILDVNNIEVHDKEKTIDLRPEEITEIEKMAKDEHIIDRLVASIVPSVRGHLIIKEGCLCSIVSPNNYLLPDGRKLRGYCHIMLCGDPSVAKSVMMQGMLGLVPRAQYAAGKAASTKGLTVSVTKDKGGWGDGAWVAEAGMLVLADLALAFVDELDKFEKEEQRDLNTVLEHAIVPVHKAGIHRNYNARCPVIAGLNPKFGRFDMYSPLAKQVNVPPDTLSRFDLIFMMLDVPSDQDKKTTRHITTLWRKTTEVHQRDFKDIEEISVVWGQDAYTPEIPIDTLRKWIAYAKKIRVRITKECEDSIYDFFIAIRLAQINDREAGIPVVWRTLDGMMRLLICETRLRLGRITEMRDVERVKTLVQESFKVMIDPDTGKMDSDIINVGMGKSQRDRIKIIRSIIWEMQDESNGAVSLDDIIAKAEDSGLKKEFVEDMLKKLKSAGEIIEPSNNRFRVI